jgi:hypothetical protein
MAGPLVTRYVDASVTTPAGTAIASPQTTSVDLGAVVALSAQLIVPPGHSGLTGWRVVYSGTVILPFNLPAQWVIADSYMNEFVIDHEVDRTLQIITYNLGVYPHTHYCRFKVTNLPDRETAPFRLLTIPGSAGR